MSKQQKQLQALLSQKQLVKVIAGIDNFDADRVEQIVRAATAGGAGAVDVAARTDIVERARKATQLPIFASSVNPHELADAVKAGADVAEIGNFDALYKDGFYLTAEDVLNLVTETQSLLPAGKMISVTIPGHLSSEAQVMLGKKLAELNVDMIQTEGTSRVVSLTRTVELLSDEDKIRLTLENTTALADVVSTPIMTASGIAVDNVENAFEAGASAVGVGRSVTKLSTEDAMTEVVAALMDKVNAIKHEPLALVS